MPIGSYILRAVSSVKVDLEVTKNSTGPRMLPCWTREIEGETRELEEVALLSPRSIANTIFAIFAP